MNVHYYTIVITLFLTSIFALDGQSANRQQPGIIYSEIKIRDDEQARWNRHINNQAYLRDFERRRAQRIHSPYGSTTIIINTHIHRNCRYGPCNSWGVQHYRGDTSFMYREKYQPARIYPIIIVPTAKKRYHRSPRLISPAQFPKHRRK